MFLPYANDMTIGRSELGKLLLHSVEKWKIYCHWKKISSNQLFSNFFSKNVIFTKFLLKICGSKFS